MSKRLGEQGKVDRARLTSTSTGLPKQADIRKSSGYDRLDEAARDAP